MVHCWVMIYETVLVIDCEVFNLLIKSSCYNSIHTHTTYVVFKYSILNWCIFIDSKNEWCSTIYSLDSEAGHLVTSNHFKLPE